MIQTQQFHRWLAWNQMNRGRPCTGSTARTKKTDTHLALISNSICISAVYCTIHQSEIQWYLHNCIAAIQSGFTLLSGDAIKWEHVPVPSFIKRTQNKQHTNICCYDKTATNSCIVMNISLSPTFLLTNFTPSDNVMSICLHFAAIFHYSSCLLSDH